MSTDYSKNRCRFRQQKLELNIQYKTKPFAIRYLTRSYWLLVRSPD